MWFYCHALSREQCKTLQGSFFYSFYLFSFVRFGWCFYSGGLVALPVTVGSLNGEGCVCVVALSYPTRQRQPKKQRKKIKPQRKQQQKSLTR